MKASKIFALILALILTLTAAAFAEGIPAPEGDDNVITVGATAVPHAQILYDVVDGLLADAGWKLQVVEFTDYVMPNTALEEGELDANYFQTLGYMEQQNADRGLHLYAAAGIHVEPMGIYSDKFASIEELPDGASISIPNDVDNGGRALLFLNDAGLLTLAETEGTPTVQDIAENPHNFKIVELEAANLPHMLPDVDAAVINGNYALEAKLEAPLLSESFDEEVFGRRLNYLVVKEGNEDSLKTQALIAALAGQETKDYIAENYNGAVITELP